jgi:hypothetical protein
LTGWPTDWAGGSGCIYSQRETRSPAHSHA